MTLIPLKGESVWKVRQPADVPAGSGNPARDLPLFTQDLLSMAFRVGDSDWAVTDAGGAFTHQMPPTPPL